MYNAVVFNVIWEVCMQTVLIAIRNYADDDSGNVDIHSRLTVKPFKKMKSAGRLFLLKNVDRELETK